MKRKIARLLPSPSLAVALVALFFAMGGTAYALVITGKSIKNGTVTGVDVKNRSLRGGDVMGNTLDGEEVNESALGPVPSADGIHRTAVVTAGGAVVRGRGIASGARVDEGRYHLVFDRNVQQCVYLGSLGGPGAVFQPPSGQITTASLQGNGNGVLVLTRSSDGSALDRPFHLAVSC